MLNRRKVLFATGSSIFLAGRTAATAAPTNSTEPVTSDVSPLTRKFTHDAAAACVKCAAACSSALPLLLGKQAIVEDCRDICLVTATLLSRRGPTAPAICQACADACQRIVSSCDPQIDASTIAVCRETAEQCDQLCNFLLGNVS